MLSESSKASPDVYKISQYPEKWYERTQNDLETVTLNEVLTRALNMYKQRNKKSDDIIKMAQDYGEKFKNFFGGEQKRDEIHAQMNCLYEAGSVGAYLSA